MELGPELVINGTFDVNMTGWTPQVTSPPPQLDAINGRGRITILSAAFRYAFQAVPVILGEPYRVRANLWGLTATATFRIGSSQGGQQYFAMNSPTGQQRSVDLHVVPTTGFLWLAIYSNSNVSGAFAEYDDVSVRHELPTPPARTFTQNRNKQFSGRYGISDRRFSGARR